MKFKYQKRPADKSEAHSNRFNVLRPIIPLRLCNGTEFIDTDAIIDSGGDDCIFSAEIGRCKFSCYTGFSYDFAYKEGVLGQQGFFDLFRVIFDLSKETIELKYKL